MKLATLGRAARLSRRRRSCRPQQGQHYSHAIRERDHTMTGAVMRSTGNDCKSSDSEFYRGRLGMGQLFRIVQCARRCRMLRKSPKSSVPSVPVVSHWPSPLRSVPAQRIVNQEYEFLQSRTSNPTSNWCWHQTSRFTPYSCPLSSHSSFLIMHSTGPTYQSVFPQCHISLLK